MDHRSDRKLDIKEKINIHRLFDEEQGGLTMQTILLYIYLILIFGVYPVITTDKYFNITITRYTFFMWTTVIYSICALVVFLVEETLRQKNSGKGFDIQREKRFYARPEFWMEAFMLANIFSYTVSIDKNVSMTGAGVRYMGMMTYVAIAVLFLVVSSGRQVYMSVFLVFAASTLYAYIVAILQHMGNDFAGYRDRIRADLYDIYISTFGNINLFASFLTISIPVFGIIYIFSDKRIYRVVSGVILFLGGMSIMAANSDSGFFGVAVAFVLIFLFATKDGKEIRFIHSVSLLYFGVLVLSFINRFVLNYRNKRGGIAKALDNPGLVIALGIILAFVWLGAYILNNKYGEKMAGLDRKKLVRNMVVAIVLALAIFLIVGKIMDFPILRIDYKWGTYRGMIWSIVVDIFKDAPNVHKIFGYGNETLEILTRAGYYDIMMENTHRIYDNAHNEILQYLITTGIVGAISYIGLFISSFVYILKNSCKKLVPYVCLGAMTGYFAQSMLNVNQPITTPFLFVFMALGVGYVRYENKREVHYG